DCTGLLGGKAEQAPGWPRRRAVELLRIVSPGAELGLFGSFVTRRIGPRRGLPRRRGAPFAILRDPRAADAAGDRQRQGQKPEAPSKRFPRRDPRPFPHRFPPRGSSPTGKKLCTRVPSSTSPAASRPGIPRGWSEIWLPAP